MKRKVLLIEDNEQNRYLVKYILEKAGHEVIEACTGQEGIDLATSEHPALILLDIQLPVMDGYSVAKELRRVASLNRVPIVAVTSYAMPGDRERVLESGCSGYIEKPINPSTFLSEITPFIEDTSPGASP
ncbi:MAG: hypothetical protein AMXMBFR84_26880 [Candidatus Hydrogenedentota bacterium]